MRTEIGYPRIIRTYPSSLYLFLKFFLFACSVCLVRYALRTFVFVYHDTQNILPLPLLHTTYPKHNIYHTRRQTYARKSYNLTYLSASTALTKPMMTLEPARWAASAASLVRRPICGGHLGMIESSGFVEICSPE